MNFGQLNVGFIQMRGVRNLGHYATAEVVSFLTKRRVKLRFLVDGDEAVSPHFRRLKEDFGSNASIHILKKREIENYLLAPRANIANIIRRKNAGGDSDFELPQATFQTQLEECVNSLKPLTMWKRIRAVTRRPIYPSDERIENPVTCDEMKSALC